MHRTMSVKGFLVILMLILMVFMTLHLMMRGDLSRKAEEQNVLQEKLSELKEEEKDLRNQLSIVGTEDYIVSSAMENYSYVNRNDIRFVFSNPEALYTYTEEELQILVDEIAE